MLQVSMKQANPEGTKLSPGDTPELPTSDVLVGPEEDELVSVETHYMSGDWRPSTDTEAKAFLDETNKYRCMHGANLLKWSDDVAANAEGYIDGMTTMVHSKSYDVPPPAGPAGENLAWQEQYQTQTSSDGGKTWRPKPGWQPGYYTPSMAVKDWYDEYANCDKKDSGAWDGCASFAQPDPAKLQVYLGDDTMENMAEVCPDPTSLGQHNGDWVCQVGHFTAMMWNGVQTMGCAYSKSANPVVVICRYKAGDTEDANTPNFNMKENQVSHVKKLVKTEAACEGAKPSGSWRVGPTQSAQVSERQGSRDPVSRDQTIPAKARAPSRSGSQSSPSRQSAPSKAAPRAKAAPSKAAPRAKAAPSKAAPRAKAAPSKAAPSKAARSKAAPSKAARSNVNAMRDRWEKSGDRDQVSPSGAGAQSSRSPSGPASSASRQSAPSQAAPPSSGSSGSCGPGKWTAPIKGCTCAEKEDECINKKCLNKGFSWSCAQSHSVSEATGVKVAGSDEITELVCAC